ncbi:MAG: hypothetical protein GF308_11085 [Candidatus Heimdallarchaeota archaeon]|nr:hypothetical protein [Candidatus Heimdallarchaeota archaeon]
MKIFEIGILNHFGQPIARRTQQESFTKDPALFSGIFLSIQYCLKQCYEDIAEEMVFGKKTIHCRAIHSEEDKSKFILLYAITKNQINEKKIREIFGKIKRQINFEEIFSLESFYDFSRYEHLNLILDNLLLKEKFSWKDLLDVFRRER